MSQVDPSRSASQGSSGRAAGTRRKELKEILRSSLTGTMWFAAMQKAASSNGPVVEPQQEQKLAEQSPKVLSFALHQKWQLTVAQGDTENILSLLDQEPGLLTRKDFVTGFTALHWLAKLGHHDSLIKVISHAQKKGYPVNVNIRTASSGLTPLHLAAQHGHELLIKALVRDYGADTSQRDYNGCTAWQYLRADTSRELMELAGAPEKGMTQVNSCNSNNSAERGCADLGAEGRSPRSCRSTILGFLRRAFAFFRRH